MESVEIFGKVKCKKCLKNTFLPRDGGKVCQTCKDAEFQRKIRKNQNERPKKICKTALSSTGQ